MNPGYKVSSFVKILFLIFPSIFSWSVQLFTACPDRVKNPLLSYHRSSHRYTLYPVHISIRLFHNSLSFVRFRFSLSAQALNPSTAIERWPLLFPHRGELNESKLFSNRRVIQKTILHSTSNCFSPTIPEMIVFLSHSNFSHPFFF